MWLMTPTRAPADTASRREMFHASVITWHSQQRSGCERTNHPYHPKTQQPGCQTHMAGVACLTSQHNLGSLAHPQMSAAEALLQLCASHLCIVSLEAQQNLSTAAPCATAASFLSSSAAQAAQMPAAAASRAHAALSSAGQMHH